MGSKRNLVENKEVIQGVLVVDNFNSNFAGLTEDIPFGLLPLVNVPILEWSLEYLSLGGVEELFVFCATHIDKIRAYIANRLKEKALWSVNMTVDVIASESCLSFGDCMRDLDAKGLIRGTFVLAEAGVIGNIKFKPIIEKHNEFAKKDKGLAMTLINVEAGSHRPDECPWERQIIGTTSTGRLVYHKRRSNLIEKKHEIPLEIFLEHSPINLRSDLMDARVMICSPSFLPLYSDNFDFQTKDDFVRGLLINEEILGSTIYAHVLKVAYATAVTSLRRYQKISRELIHQWSYPITPTLKKSRYGLDVIIGKGATIGDGTVLDNSVIGSNVRIGRNVQIKNSYLFDCCNIEDNVTINYSIIGANCTIKSGCKLTESCVLGNHVLLNKNTSLQNETLVAKSIEGSKKLNEKAYVLNLDDENESDEEMEESVKYSRLYCEKDVIPATSWESDLSDTDEEALSHTRSPIPDDTNLFFTEVLDSMARGFEDRMMPENLILEINSSRYAYNITLKEVNFYVVKAILSLPFQQGAGQQFWPSLRSSLQYFSPVMKNYLKNKEAMGDCLMAIEDIVTSNTEIQNCIVNLLNWFYDKDYLSEEAIIEWFSGLDMSSRLFERVQPFIKWLQEAETASSEED